MLAFSWASASVPSQPRPVSIPDHHYVLQGDVNITEAMFAAECSPPKLRGALTMQWQMWTAFGIMVGYVADLAFYFVSVFPQATGIIRAKFIYPKFSSSLLTMP